MSEYTEFKRGSEWRRWDLHIHTPGTKKNDQFEGGSPEEKWNKFIDSVNNTSDDISVIGITDYFSIDNYMKFKDFFNSGYITKKIDLIIPNIELRITPVTGSAKAINIHCLFNPSIDTEIEDRFLSKLSFRHNNSDYSAKRSELCRLGRTIHNNPNLNEETAVKKGIEQFVLTHTDLIQVFDKDVSLRNNTIIVVANSGNDGVSGIVKHTDFLTNTGSQLDATRQTIYQFSDAIFSSHEGDKKYFTGKGADSKESVIQKCHSLMPCYHGSDAHSNNKIFKPDENRFCWIKADPTFEGLKQTLYEPEDRVKIQAFKPDQKNERYIISEIQFLDESNLFGSQKIFLNDNLNAIIGGKSSGKSLLLYSIAKSIDPDQVERTSKRLNFDGYKFEPSFNFEVLWKNQEKDALNNQENKNHKITYIPQLYINHLVEKNNKEELNKLIENILLQDSNFKNLYEEIKSSISKVTSEIETLVNDYLNIRQKLIQTSDKIKNLGKSETIAKGIEATQKSIDEGQKLSNLNTDEFKSYTDLTNEKSSILKATKQINDKEKILEKVLAEVKKSGFDLLGKEEAGTGKYLKGKVDRIFDEGDDTSEDLLRLKDKIKASFEVLILSIEKEVGEFKISETKKSLVEKFGEIDNKLKPFLKKIAGQQELEKLTKNLEQEKIKLQDSLSLEKQYNSYLENYKTLRNQISSLLGDRFELYQSIQKTINDTKKNIGSEITLECKLVFRQEDFPLDNQVKGNAIGKENFFNKLFSDGLVKYEMIPDLFSRVLRVVDDKLMDGVDISIPLKQNITLDDVLKGLVKDSFELDYTVSYKQDDLLSMSPGKKGTVLLILFLQISSSEFPILIDQPEDNLDNRTIYDLLCRMIKEKKKERQIIIVSHNANLVVATDTENIIVANQEGQDNNGGAHQYRFEYVNGSLEHSFVKESRTQGILYQQGIKEHVCDILEGGNEAFKQRELKYALNR